MFQNGSFPHPLLVSTELRLQPLLGSLLTELHSCNYSRDMKLSSEPWLLVYLLLSFNNFICVHNVFGSFLFLFAPILPAILLNPLSFPIRSPIFMPLFCETHLVPLMLLVWAWVGAIHRHTGNLPVSQSVCATFVKMETDPVTPFRLEVAQPVISSLPWGTTLRIKFWEARLCLSDALTTGQPYPNCATAPFYSVGRPVVLPEPLSPAALLSYSVSSCSCRMPLQ